MKVFISSVIRGLETYREAASRAARALRHEVKRAEDFSASAATPQQACLAGVRWADAVILILGSRYGDRQPSGSSPTHEEYREARERCPVLVFIQRDVNLESEQEVFVRDIQDWSTGHFTARFSNPDELRDEVTAALRDLELSRAVCLVDESEMLTRARAFLPEDRHSVEATLALVIAVGPKQQIVRPKDLESDDMEEAIAREALFGPNRLFDRKFGTKREIRNEALIIEQENASILLDQLGTIRLIISLEHPKAVREVGLSGVAIKEEVEASLRQMLKFAGWTLDHVDPLRRVSDVVVVTALQGALTWRTRAEHERDPHTFPMRPSPEPAVVQLTPARRHRAALSQDTAALAEDLSVLLGRRMRP
jgi:Domain of unknown function (DUF4062)